MYTKFTKKGTSKAFLPHPATSRDCIISSEQSPSIKNPQITLVLLHSRPYLAPYHASIITPFSERKDRSPARIQALTSYQRVLISGCCCTSQNPEKSFVLQKMTFSTIFQTFKKRWKISGEGAKVQVSSTKDNPPPLKLVHTFDEVINT